MRLTAQAHMSAMKQSVINTDSILRDKRVRSKLELGGQMNVEEVKMNRGLLREITQKKKDFDA